MMDILMNMEKIIFTQNQVTKILQNNYPITGIENLGSGLDLRDFLASNVLR
jgi:hypothetical protein